MRADLLDQIFGMEARQRDRPRPPAPAPGPRDLRPVEFGKPDRALGRGACWSVERATPRLQRARASFGHTLIGLAAWAMVGLVLLVGLAVLAAR